jgi:hypothetical protein
VVPGWPVAFIAIGALALTNIVALVPGGWRDARLPRSE